MQAENIINLYAELMTHMSLSRISKYWERLETKQYFNVDNVKPFDSTKYLNVALLSNKLKFHCIFRFKLPS